MVTNIAIFYLLFILSLSASDSTTSVPYASLFDFSLGKNCSARCERLFNRSLNRIGYSIENVSQELRAKGGSPDANVICWKFLDYDDCERQCENSKQAEESTFSQNRLFIVRKCSKLVSRSPYLKHFKCLHRFHTFLEVRCSSYAKEATRYRYLSKLAKSANGSINIDASLMPVSFITKKPRKIPKNRQMSRETLIQESCRYLHYHSTCLANAVFNHCPNANDLFNKFTLLDYFLSFVIPKNDQMFTDRFLEYCKLFDFQKIARDLFDSTKTTVKRHVEDEEATTQPGIHVTSPLKHPSTIIGRHKTDKTGQQKNLFSSDEDLAESPPNFYYSSAKYTNSYLDALQRFNFYRTTLANRQGDYAPIDEFEFITHPVSVDFSFETDENQRYNKKTPSAILTSTDPDRMLTRIPFTKQGRTKDQDYIESNEENDEDYSPPILWPQTQDKDYIDEYDIDANEPLFRNERPHVFRIRQYGIDYDKESISNRGQNSDDEKEQKTITSMPYDYLAFDDEEADDPNDITYPGRKEREKTTKSSSNIPSFSDMIRTFVTTALHPTTPNPDVTKRRSNNSLLWLVCAYLLFFLAAIVILASFAFASIIIRRRRRHDYYKTFIVKNSQKL